jgi:DNA polymerase III sliding clamp (beta) subunit (PCNA family)
MASVVDTQTFLDALLAPEPEAAHAVTAAPVEFRADRVAVAAALDRALVVVPTGDAMPVLKNLQIHAGADALRIIASDGNLSLMVHVPDVTISHPGTFVIPAKASLDMLRQGQGTHVTIAVHHGHAAIVIGRTRWTLRLAGGIDFPHMPDVAEATLTAIDRPAFLHALHTVRYAAGRDPSRPGLTQLDIRQARVTAADGTRFQQAPLPASPGEFAIPAAAADDLIKLLRSATADTVDVGQSPRHLLFGFGTDMLIAGKLAAPFPDMEALLLRPALENQSILHVSRAELIAAIKRVRITADPQTLALGLSLDTASLAVRTRDQHGNDAIETLDVDWSAGPATLTVNHAHLTDMITVCPQATLRFQLGTDTPTRRAPLLLANTDTGAVGVVQQMLADWSVRR